MNRRIIRVWIEEDICLSHGFCVSECPEAFLLDHTLWVAKVRPDAEKFYVTRDAEIRSAVSCCPVACIHIEEADE